MREVRGGPGLQIKVPPGNAFACQTPDTMPKMHFLCACVGKRGSGKMVASINLLEKLQTVDRLFYVSPSADSNSASLAKLGRMLHKEDMYSNVNDVSILAGITSLLTLFPEPARTSRPASHRSTTVRASCVLEFPHYWTAARKWENLGVPLTCGISGFVN